MDSPLMPTIHRPHDVTSSPSAMMSDLSLVSSPLSPSDHHTRPFISQSVYYPSSSSSQSPSASHQSKLKGVDKDDPKYRKSKAQPAKPRFSLFAAPQAITNGNGSNHAVDKDREDEEDEESMHEGEEGEVDEEGDDQTIHAQRPVIRPRPAQSEDKLRESLYELQEMNEVFEGFLGALEAARGHNERLAIRVKQTSTLLDQYTALLGQTEHTQRLILNPKWTGAFDDAAALAIEEEEKQAAEAAAEREAERVAEVARLAEEERERLRSGAARAREAPARGGTRGRGTVRGGTVRGRGSGIPTTSMRQPSATGTKTPTGLKKPSSGVGAGLGGKYADVKSSGYGPSRKAT